MELREEYDECLFVRSIVVFLADGVCCLEPEVFHHFHVSRRDSRFLILLTRTAFPIRPHPHALWQHPNGPV